MAPQPLGGICWGASAWRPCWPLSTALGSVSWLAPGLPPAAAPSPPGASRPPLPPPPWPSLALPPPAVLRPPRTAGGSRPTRIVDLIILRVSPGPFFFPLAVLATGPPIGHSGATANPFDTAPDRSCAAGAHQSYPALTERYLPIGSGGCTRDMAAPIRRIGVLTSGGDAPGLNAVIRAVVRS